MLNIVGIDAVVMLKPCKERKGGEVHLGKSTVRFQAISEVLSAFKHYRKQQS